MRRIETEADVAEGAAFLSAADPALARALEATGPLPLRRRADGFAALLNAIVSQQLSVASAASIWRRLEAAGATDPARVAALDDETLLGCGLSRPKLAHLRALVAAGPDYAALRALPDAEVIAELVRLPGIGVWTAEIYALASLGRADVFPAGDLAIREAARLVLDLPERPSERALRALATRWSPWRAVAARLFWAYYRVARQREGLGA